MHNSMIIKDRSFHSKMYCSCFTATSAVDWLLMNGYADSRSEGIQLCKELVTNHIICGLTNGESVFSVEINS